MAVLRHFTCLECGEQKHEATSSSDYSSICHGCKKKIAGTKRREFLAGRAGLTVEERLSKIEAWIYDYKPPVDINSMLFG